MRTRFILEACLLFITLPLLSQQPQLPDSSLFSPPASPFPENDEARRSLRELLYLPSASLVGGEEQTVTQSGTGPRVRFRIVRQGGYLYYLFLNEETPGIPIAGRGNYIVKRDPGNGKFVQIKVFIRDHPGCFVRLFPSGPSGGRTSLDVYLFGLAVDRNVILPAAFETFLTEPFARVRRLSRTTVRWEQLLSRPQHPAYRAASDFVDRIRQALPLLADAEDGAMDADQRFVYIATGLPQEEPGGFNCSGFAKWVVDGFYYPLTGRYLDIEALKEKHLEYRGNRWSLRQEEQRDPFFGLDWSRNLARYLWEAHGFSSTSPEDFDVRQVDYLRYSEDVGFPVGELEVLLFLESSLNPGYFYVGSLNREYGGQPVLRQHFHMVVLFPFFRADGTFRVAVFDRNRQSSLEEIGQRFTGDFIHLVRLPLGESFSPPAKGLR